jgi:signal transduction histidine kinase
MRLLNASLKSYLFYSVLIVLVATPVGFLVIRQVLEEEVDELLRTHLAEFGSHIKNFEYLDDLPVDLTVMDRLSYDLDIRPDSSDWGERYENVAIYDSLDHEVKPYRQLTSRIFVKTAPYALTIRMSLVENDKLVFVVGIVMTALIVFLTLGLFLINRALSKKVLSPFYNTLQKLRAFQLDKGEAFQYEQSKVIEFNDLNQAIRLLTEKNVQVFQQQKTFIENASHELQTPLAIFQSKLDLLMQSHDLTGQQAQLVKDMIVTNQRIAKLNNSLLFISKLENDQFLEKEEIDLSGLLEDSLQNILSFTDSSRITTTSNIKRCVLLNNRYLMEVLIGNLLRNAYQHNTANGRVTVALNERELIVRNTGEKQAIAPDQLFKRFMKDNTGSKGTGLGLSIAEKICQLSGYTIRYAYSNEEHIFTVLF